MKNRIDIRYWLPDVLIKPLKIGLLFLAPMQLLIQLRTDENPNTFATKLIS